MLAPDQKEFATRAKDGATQYVGQLLPNEDTVLSSKGRGNIKIYQDVLRDPQVKAVFQQRRQAVVSSEMIVEPASDSPRDIEIADFIRQQIESLDWSRITDKMLFSIYYGYAVAEVLWEINGERVGIKDIKTKKRERYRFDKDGDLFLLTKSGMDAEKVPDRKFWVISTGADNDQTPYGLGLAHYLYWPVFFKKNSLKFWLIFLEKFGMPTAAAKMPSAQIENETTRKQAMEALQAIQSDSGVLIPEGIEISLIEASRAGSPGYEGMQDQMNAAISKIVVSQTMTTDDGSSRSQSQTHKEIRDEIVSSDSQLINESFRRTVVRWLIDWNFSEEDALPFLYRKTEPDEDAVSQVERDKGIYDLGFKPTTEYISTKYGEGWVEREEPSTQKIMNPGAPGFTEAGKIELERVANRTDQQSIAIAAEQAAKEYEEMIGDRVQQLVEMAENTQDFETFRKKLNEMASEPPSNAAVQKINNMGVFSRLMGLFKGQN